LAAGTIASISRAGAAESRRGRRGRGEDHQACRFGAGRGTTIPYSSNGPPLVMKATSKLFFSVDFETGSVLSFSVCRNR